MKTKIQNSLISVHFVCVQAVGSLGCSLAITISSLSVYIQVERLSQTPFTTGLRFPKYQKFCRELLFQLNFVYNLSSGEFIFGFCLFKNIRMHYQRFQLQLGYKQIKSVRFTFRSRDFPKTLLHLAYVLQNTKLEYKTPQLLHKAKQSQE